MKNYGKTMLLQLIKTTHVKKYADIFTRKQMSIENWCKMSRTTERVIK